MKINKDNNRMDLHKIYNKVKICKTCKGKYGVDKAMKDNGICNPCSRKYVQLTIRKKKKIINSHLDEIELKYGIKTTNRNDIDKMVRDNIDKMKGGSIK